MPDKKMYEAVLLADLSQLYFAHSRLNPAGKIDYPSMVKSIAEHMNVESFDSKFGWTSLESSNPGQVRFLNALGEKGNWKICDYTPRKAAVFSERGYKKMSPEQAIRFDTQIAYALARLVDHSEKILILSGAYSLFHPMLDAKDRGVDIALAFFQEEVDPRWLEVRGGENPLDFLDLSDMDGLCSRADEEIPGHRTSLHLLP